MAEETEGFHEMWEEEMDNDLLEEKIETLDEGLVEDIKNIEDPEIREREIEIATHIQEKETSLKAKLDSGEISKSEYLDAYEFGLRRQKSNAKTRCGLASVGITYDHLGNVSEDYDLIASGKPEIAYMKQRVNQAIDVMGEDAAEELAGRMLEEETLSERGHKSIKRQIRLHGK